jgi:hypothetical protein
MATVAGLLCRFYDGGRNEILKRNMRACARMYACVCVLNPMEKTGTNLFLYITSFQKPSMDGSLWQSWQNVNSYFKISFSDTILLMHNLPYIKGDWESCQFDVLGAVLLYALNLDNKGWSRVYRLHCWSGMLYVV